MKSFKTLREKMKDPCWKNYKMVGTKKKGDAEVPNCVPEEVKKGLYYYVNLRKKAGTSRSASNPKAPSDQAWKDAAKTAKNEVSETAPAWTRKEGKNPTGGLNAKGIASYRAANPGSKLSMAVTTPPSKLDPKGKAAGRRRSFCARMGGSKGPMKDEHGEPTRKALALRKWNC